MPRRGRPTPLLGWDALGTARPDPDDTAAAICTDPPPGALYGKPRRNPLPFVLLGIAVVAAIIAIAAIASAPATKHQSIGTGASIAAPTEVATTNLGPSATPPLTPAHVGDTISVKDESGGNVDLTLVKVQRVVVTDSFSAPSPGHVYYGAHRLLKRSVMRPTMTRL